MLSKIKFTKAIHLFGRIELVISEQFFFIHKSLSNVSNAYSISENVGEITKKWCLVKIIWLMTIKCQNKQFSQEYSLSLFKKKSGKK